MEFGPGGGWLEVDEATVNREAQQARTREVEHEQRLAEGAAAAAERGAPPDGTFDNLPR